MILVDTTVLLYAVGDEHPLADSARAFMSEVRLGKARAHTTPEVIQEFVHVRAKRRGRRDAFELAQAYVALFSPLQVINPQHLGAGLELWRDSKKLGAFDAVLAAVAMASNAMLVSADQGFRSIKGLDWRDLARL